MSKGLVQGSTGSVIDTHVEWMIPVGASATLESDLLAAFRTSLCCWWTLLLKSEIDKNINNKRTHPTFFLLVLVLSMQVDL